MTRTTDGASRILPGGTARRLTRSLFSTIPIVLAGSMAMSMNLSGPLDAAQPKQPDRDKASPSQLGKTIREALAAAHAASTAEATGTGMAAGTLTTAAAPTNYTVAAGDTISSIAGRYGLATASVLALNGLGWKSVIFPGQVLTLTSASAAPIQTAPVTAVAPNRYTIVAGDTISAIASRTGVPAQAILSANGLSATSTIYAGRTLTIPGVTSAAAITPTPVSALPVSAAPVTSAPVTAPSPINSVAATAHVIQGGDTVASIAKQYGVSIQAILNANGLGWSSIIYGGRSLVIPGVAVTTATVGGVTPLTPEMTANARTIISVGRSLGVSDYGLVVALSAAMQESSLLNLDYGDRDSLGLFQQRPSTGWGTPAQVTDPTYASRLFFGGPAGPNRGITAGLLDIPGWNAKTVTQAAQAVQRSAYPDAYAKWEVSAWSWLDQLS